MLTCLHLERQTYQWMENSEQFRKTQLVRWIRHDHGRSSWIRHRPWRWRVSVWSLDPVVSIYSLSILKSLIFVMVHLAKLKQRKFTNFRKKERFLIVLILPMKLMFLVHVLWRARRSRPPCKSCQARVARVCKDHDSLEPAVRIFEDQ